MSHSKTRPARTVDRRGFLKTGVKAASVEIEGLLLSNSLGNGE
jgi:hypothetical protein